MKNHPSLLLVMTLITSCTPWPAASRGGNAEGGYSAELYQTSVISPEKPALLQQLQMEKNALLMLEQKGARECVPAALKAAQIQTSRVEREIEGDLLEDAYNDAVILRKQVHHLALRLDYVAQRTQCAGKYPDTHQSTSRATYTDTHAPEKSLLMEVHFDTGSSAVSEGYRYRIQQLVAGIPENNDAWRFEISAHADARDEETYNLLLSEQRAKTVSEAMHAAGIEPDRIITTGAGESLPLLSEPMESARTFNRRVEIWMVKTSPPPENKTAQNEENDSILLKDWPQEMQGIYAPETSSGETSQ